MELFITYDKTGRITAVADFISSGSDNVLRYKGDTLNWRDFYIQNKVLKKIPSCPSPNHIFDYTVKQWVDPRILPQLKLDKWAEIKKERDTTETSGFIWNSLVFDSDTKSQQRIQSAAQQAQLNRTLIFNWVLANNESVELTSIQILELYIQLGKFIQANFEKARVIRNQIELCNTAEELSNISW
jgi:hypothetical protein